MAKIVLTGGGSAGHVIPHLALLPYLKEVFEDIQYIGGINGIERDIIGGLNSRGGALVPYHGITAAKLRRSLSPSNLFMPFKVLKGRREAKKLLIKIKPDVVFSKGGFVSVPIVWAAAALKIPVVLHESDITPGLANKMTAGKARAVCTTFESAAKALGKKAVFTGSPIRVELFKGDKMAALRLHRFTGLKPVLLVMGGSLGAVAINNTLRAVLPSLVKKFDIIHICGKGNLIADIKPEISRSYAQYEFTDNIADLFAAADIVVTRGGSNAISELLALKKPMLIIPLPKAASRGDQILNAAEFKSRGVANVLPQENMTENSLALEIDNLYVSRNKLMTAMKNSPAADGTRAIFTEICKAASIK